MGLVAVLGRQWRYCRRIEFGPDEEATTLVDGDPSLLRELDEGLLLAQVNRGVAASVPFGGHGSRRPLAVTVPDWW